MDTKLRRSALFRLFLLLAVFALPCLLFPGCGDPIPAELRSLRERNPETAAFVDAYETEHGKHHVIDLSGDYTPGEIPLFLQWDVRWGYETYGDSFLALTGCGPTCLSMVAVGLTGDLSKDPLTVARFAMENGYYAQGAGSSWTLISEGAGALGLAAEELPLDGETILARLSRGQPIICSVGPGDFTSEGHFLVLTGADGSGRVTLNDPNSRRNSQQSWDLQSIMGQINNLWAMSAA